MKGTTIILIILAIVILLTIKTATTESEIKAALRRVINDYGSDTARDLEKIYRLETANFTSGGFTKTFAPGMQAATKSYPFGWTSLENFWDIEGIRPDIVTMKENGTGNEVDFLRFATLQQAFDTVAYWLQSHLAPQWFSTDASQQLTYMNKLNNIIASYTNSLV